MTAAPFITDRVNSVNAKFCNTQDERTLFISHKDCPLTNKAFLTQTYKNGAPVKNDLLIGTTSTFVDGPIDAVGYLIYTHWPLMSQNARKMTILGF